MPRKAKRPCAYPGCPNLTEEQYCEEHKAQVNREYERFGRDPATKRMYKGAWPKIRERYVKQHPFCEACYKEGRLTPVEHVHHIVPLSKGGTHDEDNLMSLCKSCHSRIHSQMGDRWGRPHEYERGT